jgi:hypothetical protein
MAVLAANGYRAIAADLRGYGDTDVPEDPAAYTIFHIVGDLIGLLDHLELPRVSLATIILSGILSSTLHVLIEVCHWPSSFLQLCGLVKLNIIQFFFSIICDHPLQYL